MGGCCITAYHTPTGQTSAWKDHLDLEVASGNRIALQCQRTLLIVGGVELNPGPPAVSGREESGETQETIIAQLCFEAPNLEVRNCLRLYNPKNSIRQHKMEFGKCQKSVLVSSLRYLHVTDQDQFTKPTCVNNLICRIQNLLPDQCNICSNEYCVKRDEISLLTCEICGQGSHNTCILDQFGVLPEEQDAFDPQQALDKLNPTGLPGLHYLCGACEESIIPDKGAGLLKRKPVVANPSEPGKGSSVVRSIPLNDQSEEDEEVSGADAQDTSVDGGTPAQPIKSKVSKICPFYRKGICRYGSSGKGCPNEHPRPCKKLLQHGNKAPNGCTLGRARCDKFHPKMCHYSLLKGVCHDSNCKLRHVTGTKKVPVETANMDKNKKKIPRDLLVGRDAASGGNSDAFLDLLSRLKVEMLEAVDARIAQLVPTQHHPPVTGNNPRMAMMGPGTYMTQGMQTHSPHHPTLQSGQPWIMPASMWTAYPQTGFPYQVGHMPVPTKQGGTH